jgi:predicted RNA binding protein YcfA (HicA-like mRNA interferase family)
MKKDYRCPLNELLKLAGWQMVRHNNHDVFQHPQHPTALTVPNKLGDRNLGNRLLKIAGITKKL